MIKHVLMVKLKQLEDIDTVKTMLYSMKNKVTMIQDMTVGINLVQSNRSYDILLEVQLTDLHALDDYQQDHYHAQIVKPFLQEKASNIISIDYEFE